MKCCCKQPWAAVAVVFVAAAICSVACAEKDSLSVPASPKPPLPQSTILADGRTLAQMVAPVRRPPGFPQPSAVCFSSRFKHPSNAHDPHDTFATAAAFHATGFYWNAGPNKEWFQEIVRRGYSYQGWLSTILPDKMFGSTRNAGRIVNDKGELVTGPWMRAWKGWWGCMNSPEYRQVYLDYAKMYIDTGASTLQMDDPGENFTARQWGGCYCPYCREKAARLGKTPPEIQRESTAEFYRWFRREIDAYAGRHVPLSCNSHPGNPCFFGEQFDFGLEELPEERSRADLLYHAIRAAEAQGKALMFTFVSTDRPLTRSVIALAYAVGTQILVPWDVYVGTGVPRYFGTPEDYADLYGFARGAAQYLDGYQDAAFVLPGLPDERHGRPAIDVSGGSASLSVFVRAVPGAVDAPIVIHCVDTDAHPQPFRLRINPARFFGDRPVAIDYLAPAPYSRAAHERAEQSKDFRALTVRRPLAHGYVSECDVPAVAPWGMVFVTPITSAVREVWPPAVLADEASRYQDRLVVHVQTATADAVIRYTLDGAEPSESSPIYDSPLSIRTDTTIKARAFGKRSTSNATARAFRRIATTAEVKPPDQLPGLRLWLAADHLAASQPSNQPVERWAARVGPPMTAQKVRLVDGRTATAPTLVVNAIRGMPAVRFASGTDLLTIPGFANQHLGGALTIFLITQAEDPLFGACGNALNGNGGTPRLYLTRDAFTYHASRIRTGVEPGRPTILSYTHDGASTADAFVNGVCTGQGTGPAYAAVGRFGGGNFAIPFWSGNTYHAGDVAEVIAFDRRLTDAERAAVERYLAAKYGLATVKIWE